MRAESEATWQPQEAPAETAAAALALGEWGFPEKYAAGVDETRGLSESIAEGSLQRWLAGLESHLARGSWLVLVGSVGVGKSMAMARVALSLRRIAPGTWSKWDYLQQPAVCRDVPRPWLPGEVLYLLAPEMGAAFLRADRPNFGDDAEGDRLGVGALRRARVLFVDDLDRFFGMNDYDRDLGRCLYHWDTLTEQRDGPGRVTVVSCNMSAEELQQNNAFARFADRARGSGLVLNIPGESQRGAQ